MQHGKPTVVPVNYFLSGLRIAVPQVPTRDNLVYRRLAPGVLEKLREKTPRLESGRLKNKLFQYLTEDVGEPRLRQHLEGMVMLMKYSPDWRVFMHRADKEYPQRGGQYMLPFPEDYEPPEVDPEAS